MSLKRKEIIVETVADLANVKAGDGDMVNLLGYYAANDGGGQTLRYSSTASGTVDGGFILNASGSIGRFIAVDQTVANVKRFGARGDGSTDDVTAIQNAINSAAAKGKVKGVFASGDTYALSATIDLKAGDYLGNKCTLVSLNGTDWANSYPALSASGQDGIKIHDFDISGAFSHGVFMDDTSNITITDCNISDIGHQSPTQERGFGIRCQGSAGAQQKNVKIINNTITNILGWGNIAGDFIYVQYTDGVIIKNNICDISNRQGIALTNSVSNAIISDNILTNVALAGIDIETNDSLENNNRIVITNNVIDQYGVKPSGQTGGQYFGITYGINVTDSIIGQNMVTRADPTKSGTYGIRLGASNSGTVVVGNYVDTAENGIITWNGAFGEDLILSSNMFRNMDPSGLSLEAVSHDRSIINANSFSSNSEITSFDGVFTANSLSGYELTSNQSADAAITGNKAGLLTFRITGANTAYYAAAGNYLTSPLVQDPVNAGSVIELAEAGSMTEVSGSRPTATDGDTTPSLGSIRTIKTANTAATNIYGFDDVVDGEIYTVIATTNDTFRHNDSTDSPDVILRLSGGVDWTPSNVSTIQFVIDDSAAREISRTTF